MVEMLPMHVYFGHMTAELAPRRAASRSKCVPRGIPPNSTPHLLVSCFLL